MTKFLGVSFLHFVCQLIHVSKGFHQIKFCLSVMFTSSYASFPHLIICFLSCVDVFVYFVCLCG